MKSPIDMALYMQLLWDLKPSTIIELGALEGGSALFFSDIARSYDLKVKIFSFDINLTNEMSTIQNDRPEIQFLRGDVDKIDELMSTINFFNLKGPILVVEDSSHMKNTSKNAMRYFSQYMKKGDCLIIEDTVIHSLGRSQKFNGGPADAIVEFFEEHPNSFKRMDKYCDFYGENITYSQNGWLIKV